MQARSYGVGAMREQFRHLRISLVQKAQFFPDRRQLVVPSRRKFVPQQRRGDAFECDGANLRQRLVRSALEIAIQALGIEQDLHQTLSAVEATEGPVVGAPGAFVERGKVGHLQTAQLVPREARPAQRTCRVAAHLHELDDAVVGKLIVVGERILDHFQLHDPVDQVAHVGLGGGAGRFAEEAVQVE